MEEPCRVFCCYACEDEIFLRELREHLMSLERGGLVIVQTDTDIDPGREWKREIDRYLDAADIILLLVSPSFIASDYCFNNMQEAIIRHKQGVSHVIPIIIRPTNWQSTLIGDMECLPKDGKPVSMWQNKDEVILSITEEIRMLVQKLSTNVDANQEMEKLLMPPTQEDPPPAGDDQHNKNASKYNFGGPVHSNVIGDNAHIDTITNIYGDSKNGIRSLEKGSKALWNGDYRLAKKELRIAVEEIDQGEQKKEAAKARYLQALAVLGEELPRHKGVVVRNKIDELLSASVRLDPLCRTYIIALATIKTDILESNALQERQQDTYRWQSRANSVPNATYDKELLTYLARCQPRLYQQTWWIR